MISRFKCSQSIVKCTALLLGIPLAAGCAHTPMAPPMEPTRVASRMGLEDGCKISIPLRRYEMLMYAEFGGVNEPETQEDWARMKAIYQVGDKFRMISCSAGNYVGAPGYSFVGMFRESTLVLEMFHLVHN